MCCLPSAQTDVSVVTLFCTQEHGLLLQDCYPKPSGLQALLALDVPYYCFSCKVRSEISLFCLHVVSSVGGSHSACVFFLSAKSKACCFNSWVFLNIIHCLHPSLLYKNLCLVLRTPAVISEGGCLSTRSKSIQKASVFLIPNFQQLWSCIPCGAFNKKLSVSLKYLDVTMLCPLPIHIVLMNRLCCVAVLFGSHCLYPFPKGHVFPGIPHFMFPFLVIVPYNMLLWITCYLS